MNTRILPSKMTQKIREFMRMESTGGLLLLAATILAMIIANSPFLSLYDMILGTKVAVQIGDLKIAKPLFLWINDGLMAIFFFVIGLEIKREILEGELSSFDQIVLPGLGALGGMVAPALIYTAINWDNSVAIDGWAIPVATDIAFALALLSLFGKRVPTALKVFLLTLAIFDDLAAIVIIAIFYSGDLSYNALMIGGVALSIGVLMNRMGVTKTSGYILLGVVLWVAVLKSGVHATLAGVLIAFCIPMRDKDGNSPLYKLEHDLHTPVAYAILPIFAFANAGLYLGGVGLSDIFHPITMGVISGLVIGKPLGIMIFVGLAVLSGFASLPDRVNWKQIFGVSCACGIGFTMSLFIAGLAFEHSQGFNGDRFGILIGSVVSAIIAYIILHFSLPAISQAQDDNEEEDAA